MHVLIQAHSVRPRKSRAINALRRTTNVLPVGGKPGYDTERSLRLEAIIVILILVEIVIILIQMAMGWSPH